jgi:hypothetical protein
MLAALATFRRFPSIREHHREIQEALAVRRRA